MRIVTVFTLIYLPATFVSVGDFSLYQFVDTNYEWQIFFSTQVVGHQGIDDNGSFSQITLWRWSKVAIPLSGLMLSIAYAWYRYEETKSRKAMRTLCRTTSPRGRRAS